MQIETKYKVGQTVFYFWDHNGIPKKGIVNNVTVYISKNGIHVGYWLKNGQQTMEEEDLFKTKKEALAKSKTYLIDYITRMTAYYQKDTEELVKHTKYNEEEVTKLKKLLEKLLGKKKA